MYRRLRILASNYGRDFGWYVEVEGLRVAALVDPRFEEMFWDSYRLEPLTGDPAAVATLYADEFWNECDCIVLRSRAFDEVAEFAFPGGTPGADLRATGRLWMRGLYLAVPCYPWDSFFLWLARQEAKAATRR